MLINVDRDGEFGLDEEFLAPYRARPVEWGFGALSWVTYQRTYSREGEEWADTCRRVIEGMMTIQRCHAREHGGRPWDESAAQAMAREAFERLFTFKWTPPGRGLWIMGTRYLYERGGAALNNCGFTSTRDIASDFAAPFAWMLHMTMVGVGVGFDTRGKGTVAIRPPRRARDFHVIGDSREGWAEALGRLLDAFTGRGDLPREWGFSQIRPRGAALRGFGGVASGPEPLRDMLESLERVYSASIGRTVDSQLIVDTMNIIGRCVVAGGVRRSAQIAFGEPDDEQFLDLKLDRNKLREYRWASNNSVLAHKGMDYAPIAARTAVNGEPGYLWLDNAQSFGRMKDPPNHADDGALGSNPCVEQTLWDRELCCLVETFPARHDTLDDFLKTLRIAFLYAKTVSLVPTHDAKTNEVMQRNRRIGCSVTGVVQAISRHGERSLFDWLDRGYAFVQSLDTEYSAQFGVPRSIKTTSVKPSGTVSLLAGATPGAHWEHAPYYIRRVRVSADHPLVEMCRTAGYASEPDHYADNTIVISFPVHIPDLDRRKADVPVREKVELAAKLQRYWSDNQVSCTAEFDPAVERDELPRILSDYEDRLKAIVFLPAVHHGYEQPPYEEISREDYERMAARLRPIRGELPPEHELEARYCEGGICDVTEDVC